MKESARYLKIVEWNDEDQCFIGSCPGIIGKCCHGDDEAAVYAELCQIVDEWIGIFKKDGRPLPAATAGKNYSGKFVLRSDPTLHQRLAIAAMQTGESLNRYCVQVLGQNVGIFPDMVPANDAKANDDVELPDDRGHLRITS